MAFIEVPHYHIGCDTPKCDNVFGIIEYDIMNRPIDLYIFETNDKKLVQPLIDILVESEWIVINGNVYCSTCSTSVTNTVLLTLKAEMGY